jgi:hypothetical protein
LDENNVNFKIMLQRLMVELVAEENAQAEIKTKAVVDDAAAAREAAKQERELKKQEALERSRLRQADPDYFKKRVELNEDAAKKKADELAAALAQEIAASQQNEEEEVEDDADNNDPFRSITKKSKNKIFVK